MGKRKALAMAAVIASVAGMTLTGTASRSDATVRPTSIIYDVETTPKGAKCYAAVDAQSRSNGWYTRARFYSKGVACTGWLDRAKGTGKYHRISNFYHTGGDPSGAGNWASTGWHYDGGYRSRACSYVDQNYGWCTGGF